MSPTRRERFRILNSEFRWSGQIIEPVDGLPFIGRNAVAQRVFVATGYSGNGMTFGTLAGMIVSDLILGRANPYADLYDATRIKPIAAAVDYVKENVAFPAHLVTDRLTSLNAEERPVQSLRPGEGGVFNSDEGKIAVCRDKQGVVHACSAVCTHLGCDVAWNASEQTWDCPCHGSRFSSRWDGDQRSRGQRPAPGACHDADSLNFQCRLPTPKSSSWQLGVGSLGVD